MAILGSVCEECKWCQTETEDEFGGFEYRCILESGNFWTEEGCYQYEYKPEREV